MQSEQLTIKGKLGPLGTEERDISLDLRPFTLLIGVQGVGKSFLSQFLYFFRDAPYLLSKYYPMSGTKSIKALVARVVEGLRAGTATSRSLASMALTPSVRFEYEFQGIKRALSVYRNRSPRIQPLKKFTEEIDSWLRLTPHKTPLRQAIFIPDERSYYSRVFNTNPTSLGESATLSIPMLEFARVLNLAAGISLKWQTDANTKPSTAQKNCRMG